MTIEEIRKNAPKGATHYLECEHDIIFLRLNDGYLECYVFGEWNTFIEEEDDEIKPL